MEEETMWRLILLVFTILTYPAYSNAEWQVKVEIDPMTDEKIRSAHTINTEGNKFTLFQGTQKKVIGRTVYDTSDKIIWGKLSLPEDSAEQLSDKKLPAMRVDKHDPIDLNQKRKTQKIVHNMTGKSTIGIESAPKWVNFSMGNKFIVNYFLVGKEILFRYYLTDGNKKYTKFSLKDADKAIMKAFNIRAGEK